jgi:hypothetical protein
MSVVQRTPDVVTEVNLLFGMPHVDFAPELSAGVFGPYRNLGIIDTAAWQKDLADLILPTSQAGLQRIVSKIVQVTGSRIAVGVFNWEDTNMRYILGGASETQIAAASVVVTREEYNLSDDYRDFLALLHGNLTAFATLEPALVSDEEVGTQATGGFAAGFGSTIGDFALDWKIALVTDIVSYEEIAPGGGVTERVGDLVVGSPPVPVSGEIGIENLAAADGGKILYFGGEEPADGTAIRVTYEPSFAQVENTDFAVDYTEGRVGLISTIDGAGDELRTGQPMMATYTYTEPGHITFNPLTQTSFAGKARLRHLTDIGKNIIWPIPKVALLVTGDPLEFNKENYALAQLVLELLDNGGAAPYGTFQSYGDQTP